MKNILVLTISLLIPIIFIRNDLIKNESGNKSLKDFFKKNKIQIIIYILFVIGFISRTFAITQIPYGFNQDEASAGYEAISLLKYGIDRKGNSFPVHFIAWGSGQNALYSYLSIPFIAIFGLSVFSFRLPMALAGCISLVIVYKLFKKYNNKIAIIGLFFFVICPWHIMKSRWALESNIFPDLVLWAVYFIVEGINNKKMCKYYLGITILSLSVYSYGSAYLFLPIFVFLLLIYLFKNKKLSIKHIIISALLIFCIVLPMILFVVINKFDLPEIKIGFVTIPRVYENRFELLTVNKNSNIFIKICKNFLKNIIILIFQNDGTSYNSLKYFGIVYISSLPFTILGLYKSFKEKNIENKIINYWFISSIVLLFVYNDANINRINICLIPIILYTIIGIYTITENNKKALQNIGIIYSILFLLFVKKYINTNGNVFISDLEQPIKYISQLDVNNIYIEDPYDLAYIYTLFYTQMPTNEFIKTAKYYTKNVDFEKIKGIGRYNFYIPNDLMEDDSAYLVYNSYEYDTNKFKETKFRTFKVLEKIE